MELLGRIFQAIQAVMNAYHEKIVKKIKPDRDDIFAALLEANHVEERNYFINRINTELSPILDDLREAHKKDAETATDTTLKDFILGNIHVPEITEEAPDEDVAQIFFKSFCSTSGINPSTKSLITQINRKKHKKLDYSLLCLFLYHLKVLQRLFNRLPLILRTISSHII